MMPELNGGRSNGCAYADSPGHIPIQRMANVSLQPAAGRPEHRGADRPGRARHLRRRRQVLVDRHAALQLPVHRPAVLPDRGRPARRPAPRRRLPGHHHRLLGLDGGRRRPETWVLGGAFNCGKAQPGQVAAVSTAARRRCSATSTSSTPPPRPATEATSDTMTAASPQDLVEHALDASTSDDCVVIVHDSTSANLRWANNTLTTNGVMHGVTVTVVAFHGTGRGTAAGSVSASAASHRPGRPHRRGRRRRRPGGRRRRGRRRAASPATRPPTGTSRPARPSSTSTTTSRRPSARRSAGPRPRAGSSTASSTTT